MIGNCWCQQIQYVIGQDEAYMLEPIPARLKIINNIRFKYACKPCEMSVKLAPLPLWPIPKVMASSSREAICEKL